MLLYTKLHRIGLVPSTYWSYGSGIRHFVPKDIWPGSHESVSCTFVYVHICMCITYVFFCSMYELTQWIIVLLETLTDSQPSKKFPAFYGTRRLITAFTRAHHLFLSWARSCLSSHFLKIHFNIIFPSMPRSCKCSLSLRIPYKNPVCSSPTYVLHAPPVSFCLIWSPKWHLSSSDHWAPHCAVFSIPLVLFPS